MGLFTKENKDLCYFCNNDYFEMFKTIDNNYVCKDCIGNDSLSKTQIQMMTLDQIIESKANFSVGKTEIASHNTYCSACAKKIESGSKDYVLLNSKDYCKTCGNKKIKDIDKKIEVVTGNQVPGYEIEKHLDLACVEALVNLGYNMNLESQSLFGKQLDNEDLKFKDAKALAMVKLKMAAYKLGGDAVIGVTISSTVFYDKRSVVATGTIVKLK